MPRLAVVTSHPIQYQAPWFRALAREADVTVFFAWKQDAKGQAAAGFHHEFEWDVPLLDGYAYEWLENISATPGVDAFAGCDTPGIASQLERGRFDACIVNGWYLKSYVQAVRACRRLRIPVLMRGDSHLKTPRHRVLSAAKYLPYRWWLSRMDAHLYVGAANRRYLRHYGVPADRLFFTPHFVENDRFAASAAAARARGSAESVRQAAGVGPDRTLFLFAGKLLEKKRPVDFVDALAQLKQRGVAAAGAIVGSGPLQSALEDRVRAYGVDVRFLGFKNQTEIPDCYAAADCLVLPSDGRETWGLVVNEAMACGVPAVVSDAVGCAEDLIEEGRTGFTYPMGHVLSLAARMTAMVDRLENARADVANAVAARIGRYTCEAAVAGTLEAVRHVTHESSMSRPVMVGGEL